MSRRQSVAACPAVPSETFLAEKPDLKFDKELKLTLTPKEMKGEQVGYQVAKRNQLAKFVVDGQVWQARVTASCIGECAPNAAMKKRTFMKKATPITMPSLPEQLEACQFPNAGLGWKHSWVETLVIDGHHLKVKMNFTAALSSMKKHDNTKEDNKDSLEDSSTTEAGATQDENDTSQPVARTSISNRVTAKMQTSELPPASDMSTSTPQPVATRKRDRDEPRSVEGCRSWKRARMAVFGMATVASGIAIAKFMQGA